MMVNCYKPEDLARIRTRAGAYLIDAALNALVTIPFLFTIPSFASFIFVAVSLLYEIVCLRLNGATVGHKVLHIRVVSIDQESLSFWQAISRAIAKQFSVLPVGMGLFMPASNHELRQGWHDQLAGTLVVRTESQPVSSFDSPRERVTKSAAIFGLVIAGLAACALVGALMKVASVLAAEYRLAQKYVKESGLVQSRLGTPLKTSLVKFDSKTGPGQVTTHFRMIVSGPEHSLLADLTLQWRDTSWSVVLAKYYDSAGHVVDLMKPMRDASDKMGRLASKALNRLQVDSALFFADSALRMDSGNVEAIGTRGFALWLKGDLNNAIYEMTRALMLDPKKHDIRLQRGLAYLDAGKYRYALEDFDRLLRARQYSPLAFKGKAIALDSLGRKEEAVMAYVDYVADELDTAKVQRDSALARLTYLRSQLTQAKK
jgi:uncharacterized RDD family membrane protein YckC/tetratricopeptide (TPR) repeat protein